MTELSPDDLPTSPCEFCGDPIVWTSSTAGAVPLPVDAAPSDHGTLLVQREPDGILFAGVASPGVARSARKMGRPTYLAHAATCPRAGEWNRPARRARRRPSPQPARRRR